MCTFGVGGNPLLIGLGGVCLFRSLLLGGTGGVSDNKSGLIFSLFRSVDTSLSPKINNKRNEVITIMDKYLMSKC